MAMLLRCLRSGEPFVTYGAIGSELEYQLGIEKVFALHIGHVAGSLMNQILELDPKAPLINVLITRPNGIPGNGAGGYLARRYNKQRYAKWAKVAAREKLEVISREREKVFRYEKWEQLNRKLFGTGSIARIREPLGTEVDGLSEKGGNFNGRGESKEHKRLKQWVAENPRKIGLRKSFGPGEMESELSSGDIIDVLFSDGTDYVAVEVKSCRSNDIDLRRGIYQCVKYRAVKEAEHSPNEVSVRALLVAEQELNAELESKARLHDVGFRSVSVNKKKVDSKKR
jgi:hypothetical protein